MDGVSWIEGLQRVGGLWCIFAVLDGDNPWCYPGKGPFAIKDLSAMVLCIWADENVDCKFCF
eukprot:2574822-Pyramimonas_sp.AAC.1